MDFSVHGEVLTRKRLHGVLPFGLVRCSGVGRACSLLTKAIRDLKNSWRRRRGSWAAALRKSRRCSDE